MLLLGSLHAYVVCGAVILQIELFVDLIPFYLTLGLRLDFGDQNLDVIGQLRKLLLVHVISRIRCAVGLNLHLFQLQFRLRFQFPFRSILMQCSVLGLQLLELRLQLLHLRLDLCGIALRRLQNLHHLLADRP